MQKVTLSLPTNLNLPYEGVRTVASHLPNKAKPDIWGAVGLSTDTLITSLKLACRAVRLVAGTMAYTLFCLGTQHTIVRNYA
ncbi:hypothetical protein GCM10028808_10600 [Spirosoma migulaei]